MDDNKFYALCWRVIAACIITLILTIGGCEAYTRSLVAGAIRSGVDPLKVGCAVPGWSERNAICVILATKP